ncbi:MAG: sensor histidine kinase [Kiritimatiellae bacterium]|nr:sensor histidine kinase [Kiritimatiellia bacterium]
MKFSTTVLVITLAATTVAWASDEISGQIADVQDAVKANAIGSVYDITARVAYPPHPDGRFFAVSDDTGMIAIWRNFDWPGSGEIRRGDLIWLQCEISNTAKYPLGAYYREATVLARDKAMHPDSMLPSEDDVLAIIAQKSSWWTRERIAIAIAAAAALLLLTLAWSLSLRVLVNRRGRELLREKAAHLDSTLRIDERTRLAVELHDSVAQNLSGVSLQVDAALRNERLNPEKTRTNLLLASAILKSSREELRNCLWDLRSRALDEPDMESAIRQTLRPILNDVRLAIRFNVPRTKLSDNTAHAVLRIIRELVSNSIKHGSATRIAIAGGIEKDRLMFSVSDNGCGFDAENTPGPAAGHFGLAGIRERLRGFAGTMHIESTGGKGTRTVISMS